MNGFAISILKIFLTLFGVILFLALAIEFIKAGGTARVFGFMILVFMAVGLLGMFRKPKVKM